jgi:hypothetical protein
LVPKPMFCLFVCLFVRLCKRWKRV